MHDIVGIVPTATDAGYFLVGSDGGVFAFGDAPFENSLPGLGVHVHDIVGIVPTADDRLLPGRLGRRGVRLRRRPLRELAPRPGRPRERHRGDRADRRRLGLLVGQPTGAVYALGAAPYVGGLGGKSPTPIVGIAATRDSGGYWLVSQNGSVFAFGDAQSYGSLPAIGVNVSNITAVVPTPDGRGYWLIGSDGGVFAFGDASEVGSLPELGVKVNDIVGAVPT